MQHRLLIVDPDRELCGRLAAFLEEVGYGATLAHDGREALSAARALQPHAVVAEVVLPSVSGYEVCRELRDEFGPRLPIILTSEQRAEPCDRVAGLLIGADDYLVKPFALDEMLNRVRSLVARTRANGNGGLTPRELEVLELLAKGLDQREIASGLVISSKTVATHIDRILSKLGAHSRAEAVAVAYREHLVEIPAFPGGQR